MKNKKEEEEYWVTSALTNDYIVADLLVHIKQQPTTSSWLSHVKWGHRKSRSKPPPSPITITTNTNTSVITNKEDHQESGSPTTPLYWSDSYDESGPDRSNNKELQSMRVTMYTQIAASENLKKRKIDLHQTPKTAMKKMTNMVNQLVQTSSVVEPKADAHKKGFVLPDLNMTPDEETL